MLRGLKTLVTRRGTGYLGYLASGVAWPKTAYRLGWGPTAPAVLRSAFAVIAVLASSPVDETAEHDVLLVDCEEHTSDRPDSAAVEALMNRAHRAGITGVRGGFDHVVRTADGGARFARMPGARQHRR